MSTSVPRDPTARSPRKDSAEASKQDEGTPRFDDRAGSGDPRESQPRLDRAHRILLETARQLGSSLEPPAIFARLQDSVSRVMRCDGLIVSSFDRSTSVIRCEHAWVGGNLIDPTTLPPLQFRPDSGGMQSQVIRTGRPMLFSDVAERVRDPKGRYYEVDKSGGVRDLKTSGPPASRSALMVPLLLEGEVVGVIQVMADAEKVYTDSDLEMLEAISLLLAVALENARLYRRANDELEERRRAEQALRDADRRKDEFLATLGHELRNPLNPILNAVELLRLHRSSEPEARRGHDVIARQVVHLTRLIDDLLDVGRITQGKLELRRTPTELEAVLAGAIDSVRARLETADQRLEVHRLGGSLAVDVDPVRLAQVFSNLLDNACKYTGRGGNIEVTIERGEGEAVITVSDDGCGIAPEQLPHLFDLFYQARRSVEHSHGGLGIGLTLVRRLVEMHGGTIAAHSDGPGRGSRFVVRLPALAVAEPAAPPVSAQESRLDGPKPRRILVADDNRDSADTMAMLLRMGGNEVEIAYDGEEAVRVADGFRPEVLVLDIGMPRLNGFEVAREVRAQPWGRGALLIAATGWGQEEDRRRSMEIGFDAHLVKPVDHGALMRLLAEMPRRVTA